MPLLDGRWSTVYGLGWPSCMLKAFILVYGPTDVLKFIPLKTVQSKHLLIAAKKYIYDI